MKDKDKAEMQSLGMTPMNRGAIAIMLPYIIDMQNIYKATEKAVEHLRPKQEEAFDEEHENDDVSDNLQTLYNTQRDLTNMAIEIFGPTEAAARGFEFD